MSNEYRIRMFDPQGYETTTEAVRGVGARAEPTGRGEREAMSTESLEAMALRQEKERTTARLRASIRDLRGELDKLEGYLATENLAGTAYRISNITTDLSQAAVKLDTLSQWGNLTASAVAEEVKR